MVGTFKKWMLFMMMMGGTVEELMMMLQFWEVLNFQ